MNEVMIDEQEIAGLLGALDNVIDSLKIDFGKLKNKDEDVFVRYMAYSKLRTFVEMFPVIMKATKHSMINGHNISHPLINTEEAKKKGWGYADIESIPFFTTKEEQSKQNQVDDVIKEFLMNLFKSRQAFNEPQKETTH